MNVKEVLPVGVERIWLLPYHGTELDQFANPLLSITHHRRQETFFLTFSTEQMRKSQERSQAGTEQQTLVPADKTFISLKKKNVFQVVKCDLFGFCILHQH